MSVQVEKVQSLGDYVLALRRRWRILVAIIPSVILISVYLAYAIQPLYQSFATILLEPSSIPKDLVETTVASYADQQIELVQRAVMTNRRMQQVVMDLDPYPDEDLPINEKAQKIIDNTTLEKVDPVTLKPLPESSAFSLYYVNSDPEIARDITRHIADLFLTYNREVRVERAQETYNFLLRKSTVVDARIKEMDQKLAEFKTRYGDALPDARVRNEGSLDRTQRDIDSLQAEIRLVEQQEAMLKLQLGQISPMMASPGTDAYTQLATLRAELAAAQQKYTPDHPDVKRLTRAVEALVAQAQLNNPTNVRPDNPDYIRVSSQLSAVERNLAALRSNANRAEMQLADYEHRLNQAPTVERDYVQLDRERKLAQDEFADIQSKLREAETAQTLESAAIGERYTLIRSPRVSDVPYSPNRLGLILLGSVLAIGGAVGLAAFRESADPSVRSTSDLIGLADLPVMGAIPSLLNHSDRRSRRLLLGGIAVAYSLGTAVVVYTVLMAMQG